MKRTFNPDVFLSSKSFLSAYVHTHVCRVQDDILFFNVYISLVHRDGLLFLMRDSNTETVKGPRTASQDFADGLQPCC